MHLSISLRYWLIFLSNCFLSFSSISPDANFKIPTCYCNSSILPCVSESLFLDCCNSSFNRSFSFCKRLYCLSNCCNFSLSVVNCWSTVMFMCYCANMLIKNNQTSLICKTYANSEISLVNWPWHICIFIS
jgi:hypothetical protein